MCFRAHAALILIGWKYAFKLWFSRLGFKVKGLTCK